MLISIEDTSVNIPKTVYKGSFSTTSSLKFVIIFVFLMLLILICMRWNISIVFIGISYMAKFVRHLFLCLLATFTTLSENNLLHLPTK
jgi:hypothetical protein